MTREQLAARLESSLSDAYESIVYKNDPGNVDRDRYDRFTKNEVATYVFSLSNANVA